MSSSPDTSTAPVRLVEKPECLACGHAGRKLYDRLADRINGVPGSWGVRGGSCGQCRAVWLDPAPEPADIGKLYEGNYFTHSAGQQRVGKTGEAWTLLERWLLRSKLGYPVPKGLPAPSSLSLLKARATSHQLRTQARAMWLPWREGGRLLDYGCGNGLLLERMAQLGWQVSGYDFDPIAAATAEKRLSIQIHSGDDRRFLEGAELDAVTMSHVIEHLPDPTPVLEMLYRALRPGGALSIATPNAASLGRRIFGSDWYNLSIPFHLFVYDQVALGRVFKRAGFQSFTIWTAPIGAQKAWLTSGALRAGRAPHGKSSVGQRIGADLFAVVERLGDSVSLSAGLGEELCAIVRRV